MTDLIPSPLPEYALHLSSRIAIMDSQSPEEIVDDEILYANKIVDETRLTIDAEERVAHLREELARACLYAQHKQTTLAVWQDMYKRAEDRTDETVKRSPIDKRADLANRCAENRRSLFVKIRPQVSRRWTMPPKRGI